MKIAQIAPPWFPIPPKNYGGTENVVYHLVEELVHQGHEVTLFAPEDAHTSARHVSFFSKALRESGVPWQAHLKAFYHLYKSIEQVKERSFDIVHTHLSASADMYLFPLTAALATPHVTTLHSNFPFDHIPTGWVGDADRFYMDWADNVPLIAISESAREQAMKQLPLNIMGVVHHGISLREYVPSAKPPAAFFAWLGRFVPEKGAHLAVQAAKQAGVPLILAGIIDRHVKDAQTYFQKYVEPHIDGNQIQYIGPASMRQKIQLFSRARGFLNPIEWEEPFGMVMIEAMALGCPVISFPRGAAPEIVVHGKNGFLAHDVNEMVSFIPRLDSIDRRGVRQHVVEHFSARVMAENYVRMYKKAIAQSREAAKSYSITAFREESDAIASYLPAMQVTEAQIGPLDR